MPNPGRRSRMCLDQAEFLDTRRRRGQMIYRPVGQMFPAVDGGSVGYFRRSPVRRDWGGSRRVGSGFQSTGGGRPTVTLASATRRTTRIPRVRPRLTLDRGSRGTPNAGYEASPPRLSGAARHGEPPEDRRAHRRLRRPDAILWRHNATAVVDAASSHDTGAVSESRRNGLSGPRGEHRCAQSADHARRTACAHGRFGISRPYRRPGLSETGRSGPVHGRVCCACDGCPARRRRRKRGISRRWSESLGPARDALRPAASRHPDGCCPGRRDDGPPPESSSMCSFESCCCVVARPSLRSPGLAKPAPQAAESRPGFAVRTSSRSRWAGPDAVASDAS